MKQSDASNAHLSPEIFVDLLDGVPVEARWRQHLASCETCRDELEGLEETQSWVKRTADVEREHEVAAPSFERSRSLDVKWIAAAAAVLLLALSLYVFRAGPGGEPTGTTPELGALLPPVDEDWGFQLLLELSEDMEFEVLEDQLGAEGMSYFSPMDLTPEERARLLEQLASGADAEGSTS